jgi:hypothetical protein
MFSSRSPANLVPGVHYRSSNLDMNMKTAYDGEGGGGVGGGGWEGGGYREGLSQYYRLRMR